LLTTNVITSRLSITTKEILAQFKIPMHKYLYTFIEPNNPLYKLRLVDVFINEEMLFLTNIILCFIYTRTKQSNVQNQDPFTFKMLLFIGDLAQLLPIYHH
jgi:hypothetical protein